MATTKKLVVLTTQTNSELQVGNQAHGVMTRDGQRTYRFIEDEPASTPVGQPLLERRECPELRWRKLSETRHARIAANANGVMLYAYMRYDECLNGQQMSQSLLDETNELCSMLELLDINALAQRCAE